MALLFLHGGISASTPRPSSPGGRWEPVHRLLLALSGALYAAGLARLWRRAGVGQGIRRWQAACFAAGWLALIVALLSPVDALGGHPVLGPHGAARAADPGRRAADGARPAAGALPLGAAARRPGRRRAAGPRRPAFAASWRRLTAPLAVFLLHGLALWIWHLPALYQATLDDDFIHALQHLSFFLSSALFWWSLIHGRFGRLGYGAAVLYVFVTSLHSGVLGALLTFAPRLWYPIYAGADEPLGALAAGRPAARRPDHVDPRRSRSSSSWGSALFAAWLGEAERRVAHTRSETLLRTLEGGTGHGG